MSVQKFYTLATSRQKCIRFSVPFLFCLIFCTSSMTFKLTSSFSLSLSSASSDFSRMDGHPPPLKTPTQFGRRILFARQARPVLFFSLSSTAQRWWIPLVLTRMSWYSLSYDNFCIVRLFVAWVASIVWVACEEVASCCESLMAHHNETSSWQKLTRVNWPKTRSRKGKLIFILISFVGLWEGVLGDLMTFSSHAKRMSIIADLLVHFSLFFPFPVRASQESLFHWVRAGTTHPVFSGPKIGRHISSGRQQMEKQAAKKVLLLRNMQSNTSGDTMGKLVHFSWNFLSKPAIIFLITIYLFFHY